MKLDNINMKLKVNTARNFLFKNKCYTKKITVRPFNILARNNKTYSSKEYSLASAHVKKVTSGDGSMVSPTLIPRDWLNDE